MTIDRPTRALPAGPVDIIGRLGRTVRRIRPGRRADARRGLNAMRDPAATEIVPKVKTHADPAAGLLATAQPGIPVVSRQAAPATPSTAADRPGNPAHRVAQ
ncbi:hypothetical protein ACVBEQ_05880 [Nakamurella sp. GG22]